MAGNFILVESGATKSDWCLVNKDGAVYRRLVRPGMNVSTMSMQEITRIISETFSTESLSDRGFKGFYMYTAGVITPEIRSRIDSLIREISDIPDVDIQNDLMGAARSVCGHGSGIAAILGTGSNVCFYDGQFTLCKVRSGGFILGDEGSAATLGKLFLSDYLKGLVPAPVCADFEKEFDASYSAIVEGVYRSHSPSGYLGSIAPFITRHRDDPYIAKLIADNFRSFAKRLLSHYDCAGYPVGIVGGFGWACREMLLPILEEEGIHVGKIIKAPADGLVQYHLEERGEK
ncbi:MAG: hypothetical protein IJL22_07140 [Bacteroidales bacterium]|nr:hypothetical protein [Bacteroidales bacterium]